MILLYQNKDHEVYFCVSTMNFHVHVIYDFVYNFHKYTVYL